MSVQSLLGKPDLALLACAPHDLLSDACALMVKNKVNAIAVIEDGLHLVGILTDHDVMRALDGRAGKLGVAPVFDWMTDKVITCSPDTKLTQAIRLMGKHGIRHLVVVDGTTPIAVLGIRAVLSKIHEQDEMEINVLRDMAVAHRSSLVS